MKNTIKEGALALFILGPLLLGQGCQRSPQPQSNQSNAATANNSNAASQQPATPETHLKVGDTAPDFTLNDTNGSPVKLSDFRGKKNVVLAFYVLAFTGG
jgi:cytochrome oxidase Cu insertion factor (SCO1/SenC/PrrC family)